MTLGTIEIPADLQNIGLHPAEQKLLAFLRHLQFGMIELKIVNGYPAMIERAIQQVKLL